MIEPFFVSWELLFCHLIDGVEVALAFNLLDIWHDWPIGMYLTRQWSRRRHTPIPQAGFEPTISVQSSWAYEL